MKTKTNLISINGLRIDSFTVMTKTINDPLNGITWYKSILVTDTDISDKYQVGTNYEIERIRCNSPMYRTTTLKGICREKTAKLYEDDITYTFEFIIEGETPLID